MKNKTKNALIVIDGQKDFCAPGGALYVPGAEEDMLRLSTWIKTNAAELDDIFVSLDSHQPMHIAHPSFWQDANGKMVSPFTLITYQDIMDGKYTPRYYRTKCIEYVKSLEDQGKFKLFIWPPHCLVGSSGHSLDDNLFSAIKEWAMEGRVYSTIVKGTNLLSEHYGIFMAEVQNEDPGTQLNQKVLDLFEKYETIYLAGEAKSHCVATSLDQILNFAPNLAKKLVILDNCMSNVPGSPAPGLPSFGDLAQPIYDRAKTSGVRFEQSTNVNLTKQPVHA